MVDSKSLMIDNSSDYLSRFRLEINEMFKKSSKKTFCSFCGSEFKVDEEIVKGNCIHRYHSVCPEFKKNFENKLKDFDNFFCPLCYWKT